MGGKVQLTFSVQTGFATVISAAGFRMAAPVSSNTFNCMAVGEISTSIAALW